MAEYGLKKVVSLSVYDAETAINEELRKVGFGLVSRIDMKEKFKQKLKKDFKDYLILGYCNPPAAFEAVSMEQDIGLLLPCNIIIYTDDDKTHISVIRPTVAMSVVDNPELIPAAKDIESKLETALERIGSTV